MGFSVIGTLIAVLMIAPSIVIMFLFPPKNLKKTDNNKKYEPFSIIERTGQVGCVIILIFSGNDEEVVINPFFIVMLILMGAYFYCWIRYVKSERYYVNLYDDLFFIPIPLAILPVGVFAFCGLWLYNIWLIVACGVFALGHIVNTISDKQRLC